MLIGCGSCPVMLILFCALLLNYLLPPATVSVAQPCASCRRDLPGRSNPTWPSSSERESCGSLQTPLFFFHKTQEFLLNGHSTKSIEHHKHNDQDGQQLHFLAVFPAIVAGGGRDTSCRRFDRRPCCNTNSSGKRMFFQMSSYFITILDIFNT